MGKSFAARTGLLIGWIVKLDRLRISLWLIGIAFFTLVVPPALAEMYGAQQERQVMAGTMANPAMTAMLGPGDLNNYTLGAMTAHQMLLLTALVVGLMAILLVAGRTRGDEEEGRLELIRSLPVGRLSCLNATLLVQIGTNALLALVAGFGLFALGIESKDLEGSLLYGAALGGTGLVFAGVTALFAQLSDSSRGTIGYSIAALMIAYMVRAVGDVGNETLSWMSPLGWVTKAGVYSANHWGPVVLMIAFALLLFIAARTLHAYRDLDQGFLPSRPGRSHASRLLQSPFGLTLRLQRIGFIAWAVGLYVLGASYGSVMGDLETFLGNNEVLAQMLGGGDGPSLTEPFLAMLVMIITLVATIPPVLTINRLRGEEKRGRVEPLLGRAVSRIRLMGGYAAAAAANGFVMMSLGAIGLWSAGNASMESGLDFGIMYGAAMAYVPAVLVMIGIATFLIGFSRN